MKLSRRALMFGGGAVAAAGVAAALPLAFREAGDELPRVTVWKSPSCGCCADWVQHMRSAGFAVTAHDVDDLDRIKARNGIAPEVGSCHTAEVEGYVLEGHVPADSVKRLLAERPRAKGLAVPGMPQGSPGMETGIKENYEVLLLTDAGSAVFERR